MIRLLSALLFLAFFTGAPAPLVAQEGGGAAGTAQSVPEELATETAAKLQALIPVLEDPAARDALIEELRRLAPAEAAGPGTPEEQRAEAGDTDGAVLSFGRSIAERTQAWAELVAERALDFIAQIRRAPSNFDALADVVDAALILESLQALALVVVATYGVLTLLRLALQPLYRGMGGAAADAGPVRTVLLGLASIAIDALAVGLAWAIGYGAALSFGDTGTLGIQQALYLNAFLAVELARLVVRVVVSPATGRLRLIDISDEAARRVARWLAAIIAVLGYGQLLVVPIVSQQVSALAGTALSSFVALLAVLIAIVLVLRSRRRVADWLDPGAGEGRRARLFGWLAQHWHWFALVYLLGLLFVVLARPGGILFPVLGASGKIAAAIVLGLIVTTMLGRAMRSGVSLPERLNDRLPLLERRLNTFVPKILLVIRLLVTLAVVAITFDVIGLVDLTGWLESRLGVELTGMAISVVMLLLFGFVAWLALSSWIDWRLAPDAMPSSRERTLLTLLRNAATIAIVVVTTMFVLSEIGIDIAPLLASAGVLGLAIGFGAQSLVQDIITGIFIQFENAINVGDVVTVGGTTGVVERLTIRSVALRDLSGTYHIIPFSSVSSVSNFNRGFAYHVMDMGVAYQEDVTEVRSAMETAFAELVSDETMRANVIGDMEWLGLQSFGDSAVVVRARLKTRPGNQWAVGRAFNEVVKRIFDERGIEIPFPHTTLYLGEARDGRTPPLRVRLEREDAAE